MSGYLRLALLRERVEAASIIDPRQVLRMGLFGNVWTLRLCWSVASTILLGDKI